MRKLLPAFLVMLLGSQTAFAQTEDDAAELAEKRRHVRRLKIASGVALGLGAPMAAAGLITATVAFGQAMEGLGCALGNLLAACGMVSIELDTSLLGVLGRLDADMATELMTVTFTPMDLLFYGIAIYEGYRLSLRPAPEAQAVTSAGNAEVGPR